MFQGATSSSSCLCSIGSDFREDTAKIIIHSGEKIQTAAMWEWEKRLQVRRRFALWGEEEEFESQIISLCCCCCLTSSRVAAAVALKVLGVTSSSSPFFFFPTLFIFSTAAISLHCTSPSILAAAAFVRSFFRPPPFSPLVDTCGFRRRCLPDLASKGKERRRNCCCFIGVGRKGDERWRGVVVLAKTSLG